MLTALHWRLSVYIIQLEGSLAPSLVPELVTLQDGWMLTCLIFRACVLQLVWLGINAFLFVHFYMRFLEERWFYTRVLLGVSLTCRFRSSFLRPVVTPPSVVSGRQDLFKSIKD